MESATKAAQHATRRMWIEPVGKANSRAATCPYCGEIVEGGIGHLAKLGYSYGYMLGRRSRPPEWGAICPACAELRGLEFTEIIAK